MSGRSSSLSGLSALLAIAVGFVLMKDVLAEDQGTPKMIEIATAIQEGAAAYLKRQFRTIIVVLIPLAVVVFITSTGGHQASGANGDVALSFGSPGSAGPSPSSPAPSCPGSPATSA